ncbi:hypothetical protein Y1Q_0002001 [Alligator mississippiensis]|uniref:Uncharacterized protein n=1 Tax=Alligator mississippiensis TaxID=8496 RepID=A0A151MP68_ALLMI|nr:hypothetical protein Y1Q_0002001 [Alligator mississippiensis]
MWAYARLESGPRVDADFSLPVPKCRTQNKRAPALCQYTVPEILNTLPGVSYQWRLLESSRVTLYITLQANSDGQTIQAVNFFLTPTGQ